MRILIVALLLLFTGLTAGAQTTYPPTGSPNGVNRFKGGLYVDSMIAFPNRDTANYFGHKGDVIRHITDGKLYFFDGTYYQRFSSADSTLYVTQYQLDTAKANLYGQDLNSLTFTGTTTKTLTLTRNNSAWIQGTFTDLDNQTLALSVDDTLSISGGNSVHLPYIRSLPEGQHQSFTGTQTTTLVLSTLPAATSQVLISMNNAWLDPVDWTRTGTLITLSFTTSTTDLITVYYSN